MNIQTFPKMSHVKVNLFIMPSPAKTVGRPEPRGHWPGLAWLGAWWRQNTDGLVLDFAFQKAKLFVYFGLVNEAVNFCLFNVSLVNEAVYFCLFMLNKARAGG